MSDAGYLNAMECARALHEVDVGVAVLDRHDRFIYANAAAQMLLGVRSDELLYRTSADPRWDAIFPDGTPLRPADYIFPRLVDGGHAIHRSIIGVRRGDTGDRVWVMVSAVPQRDAQGSIVSVVISLSDVGGAQQALRQWGASDGVRFSAASRTQIQRVLDAVPGIVFQYRYRSEQDNGLVFVAGRIREVLGMREDEVHLDANVLFERLAPVQRAFLREAIARAIVTRGPFQHEVSFEHVDGGERWLRLFGVPDTSPDGIYYTGVMLDITAERQLAEALRQRQRREAMGDMAAGIAHNFNNMLAVILPNLQMAREQSSSPVVAELLVDAERAALSAADLVRRMLALGRSESTETHGHVDLVPIVHEALHICRQTFDRGITITDSIRVPRAMVRGTASELQQVLLNLCLNARDALAGVPHPSLTVCLEPDGDESVRLIVRDTGCGMSEATRRRIGEPFFTTKQPGRGTGLGLASAFHTISEAGGRWTVLSTAGTGTTFVVHLPVAVLPERPRAPEPTFSRTPLEGTVLVVDDEPMVRAALARQVTRTGMQAEVADSAEIALERVHDGIIEDLRAIVLDLSMPGMSGEDALPRFKALVPEVPVIALSGFVPEHADLALASAILGKPVGQHQLETVLRDVLA